MPFVFVAILLTACATVVSGRESVSAQTAAELNGLFTDRVVEVTTASSTTWVSHAQIDSATATWIELDAGQRRTVPIAALERIDVPSQPRFALAGGFLGLAIGAIIGHATTIEFR